MLAGDPAGASAPFRCSRRPIMSEKQRVAAIEGWFTLDPEAPQLIGSRCTECGTCYFPRQESFCRNPACQSTSFEEAPLSRTGTLWSYTNACYQPPEPFVAPDPFEPFAIAAVQLEEEGMIDRKSTRLNSSHVARSYADFTVTHQHLHSQ